MVLNRCNSVVLNSCNNEVMVFGVEQVSQDFLVYPGMAGNNTKEGFRASGAYIFRPNATEPDQLIDRVEVISVEG